MAAARVLLVALVSAPENLLSHRCTALSAPSASPYSSTSLAHWGPIESNVISESGFIFLISKAA